MDWLACGLIGGNMFVGAMEINNSSWFLRFKNFLD